MERAGKIDNGFDLLKNQANEKSMNRVGQNNFSVYSNTNIQNEEEGSLYYRRTGNFIDDGEDYEEVPIINPLAHFHENFQQIME